ncbi:hypothetical protein C1Y11_16795 [Pseudomonas sp. FW305-20]|nr:hypothetical protein C1Y11_16795 [Pseudomonas sp. FW305-20]PMU18647.1 hypothetical protein C1Y10_12210 [Pseudomonas sp. FW305-122]PMU40963.1 hypothetical protein C1Y12_09415 [Pseudomonas sp. FW305-47B]PMX61366.1 hypothetical protein C1Y13_12275 [Pseudomonas sp. FW305-33]PMX69001.1 hypothetical protein C1X12_09530 [Pseudomonas sp. FW305-60]
MGMPQRTLRVRLWDAERPGLHSHAERGNDHRETKKPRHSQGGAFVFQQPVTQTILSPTCRIFIPLVPPMVW